MKNCDVTSVLSIEDQLRRSVLSCMLWEDTFYESGKTISERISELSKEVNPKIVSLLAQEARSKYKLRSVPLLLANELAKKGGDVVSKTLENIIQRPDEIVKFMEIYWQNGKTPISKQVKKGLSKAFNKFNEYQLAKWNRDGKIKLRDVMFMVHPSPANDDQKIIFNKLAENNLTTPDTWEVGLSKAKDSNDKRIVWETLLSENKLGAVALLKNLRNMISVGVQRSLIVNAIRNMKTERVLPFRFVTADRYATEYSDYLQEAMYRCLSNSTKIEGKTVLLVDVSGSMNVPLSKKSVMTRLDAAIGLSILLQYLCNDIVIYTFSSDVIKINTDKIGFQLGEEIDKSQFHECTYLGMAVKTIIREEKDIKRFIVITDEQSQDKMDTSFVDGTTKGYMLNVAPYENSIDFDSSWTRINGFSESVIDFIQELEKPLINWTSDLDVIFDFSWETK